VLQEQLTKVTDAYMETNAVSADHRQELEHQLTDLLNHANYESADVVKEELRRLDVCHEELLELSLEITEKLRRGDYIGAFLCQKEMKEVRDLAASAVVIGRRSPRAAARQQKLRRLDACHEKLTKLSREITENLKRKDYVGASLLQKHVKEVRDRATNALDMGPQVTRPCCVSAGASTPGSLSRRAHEAGWRSKKSSRGKMSLATSCCRSK
jgi:hypothetical protein